MKNKFFSLGMATGVMMAFGSSAFASTLVVDRLDGYFVSPGGEFNVVASQTPSLNNNYNSNAIVINSNGNAGFETFCLEKTEGFPAGGFPTAPLNYAISASAISGGGGAIGNPLHDPVSIGTAFLYSQFAAGTLAGYDYADHSKIAFPQSPRAFDAQELQMAIWYLEDEITLTAAGVDANGNTIVGGNPYVNLAISTYGTFAAAHADAGGAFNVAALNIGDPNTVPAFQNQDLLVITSSTSVPDGGTTAMLLGIALGGVALLKRKLA
jgi:VPDSG-CTERM motif